MKKKGVALFMTFVTVILTAFVACNSETPQPQGYTTPTAFGRLILPESASISYDDLYVMVAETGMQSEVAADGTWTISNLEAGKTYTLFFQDEPFVNLSRDLSSDGPTYAARMPGVGAATGAGYDNGVVQVKMGASINGEVQTPDGQPLADATIRIEGTPYATQSGDDGHFKLAGLPDGIYQLVIEHPGRLSQAAAEMTVIAEEGEAKEYSLPSPVVLSSTMGAIQGSVYFEGSTAIGDKVATVRVENVANPNLSKSTTTDGEGLFFMDGLEDGEYRIVISSTASYQVHTQEGVTISSGTTTYLDPVMLTAIGGTYRGKVSTSDGISPDAAGVLMKSLDGEEQYFCDVDASGNFAIYNVIPGDYSVSVSMDGYATIENNVTIGTGSDLLHSFTLIPVTGSISGMIKLTGAPDNSGVSVTAVNINDSSERYSSSTIEDGTFTIRNIRMEGKYQVELSKDGYVSVSSMTVDVKFGEMTIIGTVTLGPVSASISGNVKLDGLSSHDGVEVALSAGGVTREAVSDRYGDYFFTNIPAGTYTMTFSKDGYVKKTIRPVVVAQSESKVMEDVVLAAEINPLTGVVTLEGLEDHSGVIVEAVNVVDPNTAYTTQTDVDGRYVINAMKPGTYVVSFSKDGFITKTSSVVIAGGSSSSLDATLELGSCLLTGSVILEGAEDNGGVSVTARNVNKPQESYTATTESDGSYIITSIANGGTYQVTASCDGYMTASAGTVTVGIGEAASVPEITLRSVLGSVTGSVSLEGALSHEDVAISLNGSLGTYETTTISDGSFTLTSIPSGSYTLIVSKDGWISRTVEDIRVTQGGVTELGPITLSNNRLTLTGSVTLEGADDHSSALVSLSTGDDVAAYSALTGADGSYTIANIVPGEYTARISKTGYSEYTERLVLSAGTAPTLDAVLEQGSGVISGRIELKGSSSYAGVAISATNSKDAGESYTTESNDDGSFIITGIESEGLFLISASTTGFATDNSVTANVKYNENVSVGTITLLPVASVVRGNVQLEGLSSHAGISVVLSNDDNTYEAVTDADGDYSFENVQPGTYNLTASFDDYGSKTVSSIAVSQSSDIAIESVILSASILPFTGTVSLEGDSADASGVLVTATSTSNPDRVYSTLTVKSGYFNLDAIMAGQYKVVFSKVGYQTRTEYVSIVPGAASTLNVELNIGSGIITGTVNLEGESDDFSGVSIVATNSADKSEKYNAITASDGTFAITGIKNAGLFLLTLSKDGFTPDSSISVEVVQGGVSSIGTVTLRNFNSIVRGNVKLKNASNHEGISIVLAENEGTLKYTATTDEEGDYVISEVVPNKTYTLSASKAGYTTKRSASTTVNPSTEIEIPGLELTQSSISISGTVKMEDAETHGGAIITATNVINPEFTYYAVSNDSGYFSFSGMEIGEYSITISKEGYMNITLDTVGLSSSSSNIKLGSINLPLPQGTISGVVKLEGTNNHAGVTVSLIGTDYSTTTNRDGEYKLDVKPGMHEEGLSFSKDNFQPETYEEPISVVINSTYTVEDEKELKCLATNVNGTVDVLGENDDTVTVSIKDTEFTCTTSDSGWFEFDHVPLGDYDLVVDRADSATVVQSISLEPCLSFNVGKIEITPNYADLYGFVSLNGISDSSGVTITARSVGEQTKSFSALSSDDGSFRLENVLSTENYIVTFEKDGWQTVTIDNVSSLVPLEERDITAETPIVLQDTIPPVITDVKFGNDSSKAYDVENVPVQLAVEENGVGLAEIQYSFDESFESSQLIDFSSSFYVDLPSDAIEQTIFVRVYDKQGNVSEVVSKSLKYEKKIVISGELDESETNWVKGDYPYMIVGDVIIPDGLTLNIEAGVEIQFGGPYLIEGSVQALGTEESPIVIHGVDDGKDVGNGVKTTEGSMLSHIEYYDMSGGISGKATIRNSSIQCDTFEIVTVVLDRVDLTTSKLKVSSSGTFIDSEIYGLGSGEADCWTAVFVNCHIHGFKIASSMGVTSYNTLFSEINELKLFTCMSALNCEFRDVHSMSVGKNDPQYFYFICCNFIDVDTLTAFWNYATVVIRNSNIDCPNLKINCYVYNSHADTWDFRNNYWCENLYADLNSNYNVRFIIDGLDSNEIKDGVVVHYGGYTSTPIENAGLIDNISVPSELPSTDYSLGAVGPAGGIIAYDATNNPNLSFDYIEAIYIESSFMMPYGYYRSSDNGVNEEVGTSSMIGSGQKNTEALVAAMGDEAYIDSSGAEKGMYAARFATLLDIGGYDWYLPSSSEAKEIVKRYTNNAMGYANRGERFYVATSTESGSDSFITLGPTNDNMAKARSEKGRVVLIRYL